MGSERPRDRIFAFKYAALSLNDGLRDFTLVLMPFRHPAWALFCCSKWDGGLWVRVLGWGFHLKDTRKHRLYFSERNGITKHWMVFGGPWSLALLRPELR